MSTSPTTSLLRRGSRGAVAVEATFPTDVDDLWDAVTDPERLARWIATVEGDTRVGGEVRMTFTTGWEGTGRVVECEPPHRLVVESTEDGEDGEEATTRITATLAATDGGAHLRVEESGLPLESLPAHGAGWQLHVEDLGSHLDGSTPGPLRERWLALAPSVEKLPVVDG